MFLAADTNHTLYYTSVVFVRIIVVEAILLVNTIVPFSFPDQPLLIPAPRQHWHGGGRGARRGEVQAIVAGGKGNCLQSYSMSVVSYI